MPYLVETAIAVLACIGVLAALRPGSHPCTVLLTGHSATISGDCGPVAPETIKALGDYLTGLRF